MRPHRIFYITRMLPHYRIPVLEQLNDHFDNALVVAHGDPPKNSSLNSLTHDTPTGFEKCYLQNYWWRGETLHAQPFGKLFRRYGAPDVVLAEESPRSITLPWLLFTSRRRGAARVLWGHFSSNKRLFSPYHPFDRYRLALARSVEACACYSRPIAQTLARHMSAEHLFVARNTVDTEQLLPLYDELAAKGETTVRRQLDLPETKPVILFVGRLIPRKGTDLLLNVFKTVQEEVGAVLCVIGDGPDRSKLEQRVKAERIPDVRFLGAITRKEDLAPYLFSADLMLIPGYLGLAVNDAFVFGLPVVSQQAPPEKRFHSPEIAYLESGTNGLLTPWGDRRALVDGVLHVLDHQKSFSRAARTYARSHLTTDHLVEGLSAAIHFAVEQTKKQ